MKRRPRIYYTEEQKALMWDRWKKGESLGSIARLFDRGEPMRSDQIDSAVFGKVLIAAPVSAPG